MTDEWNYYPCQMGEHRAFIFYDHGIQERIDEVAPANLLRVRVAFQQPRDDGLPTREEFAQLSALEDDLQALVQGHASLYVGRVTVDGERHFFIYTADSEYEWALRLDALGQRHGYQLGMVYELDDQHKGYWEELFPTKDDWQVIKDLQVLEALEKHGDDNSAVRPIDHWAYFPSLSAAEPFLRWLVEKGYQAVTADATDDGKARVRFRHEGTVQLSDITSHTIALRRRACEFSGDYDGWETPVRKSLE